MQKALSIKPQSFAKIKTKMKNYLPKKYPKVNPS